MPFIADSILDLALQNIVTNCENFYLCSTEPTTFTEASSTNKLGTKATPSIGAPTNGDVDGRKIVVAAITDGTVNTTGTAASWALTDNSLSVLQVTSTATSQAVTAGNIFTTTAASITLRDPT